MFEQHIANLATKIQRSQYDAKTKVRYLQALSLAVESKDFDRIICTFHSINISTNFDLALKSSKFFTLSTQFTFEFDYKFGAMSCTLRPEKVFSAEFLKTSKEFGLMRFDPEFILAGVKNVYIVWYDPVLDLMSLKYLDEPGGYKVLPFNRIKEDINIWHTQQQVQQQVQQDQQQTLKKCTSV